MKIALINIPDNGVSGKGYSAPLGLAYIASVIRNLNHEVFVYDLSVSKESIADYYLHEDTEFLNRITSLVPDVIGMTCSTTNRFNVAFWANVFKQKIHNVKIVIGGPHPFFIVEEYLQENKDVDFLVLGEGERAIVNLISCLDNGGYDYGTVKGIAYRKDDEIIINERAEIISDLDEIPFPARDLFPMMKYDISFGSINKGKAATIITSRGCGNTCKFCSTTCYWTKLRYRTAKNIIDEIETILEHYPSIRDIIFFDDTFTANRKHAVAVCSEIINRNIKFNWACWSRTNILDKEFFEILKESGCTTLAYGIESGNDEMLKVMRKNSTVTKNHFALHEGRKHGICTRGTMIGGMPEEKFEWALDSILFIAKAKIPLNDLRISFRTFIFPGTYWETWFSERYPDFTWSKMPSRFKKGAYLDDYGNIILPCYQWKGFPYFTIRLLYSLMFRYSLFRWLLRLSIVQSLLRIFVRFTGVTYPKSVFD